MSTRRTFLKRLGLVTAAVLTATFTANGNHPGARGSWYVVYQEKKNDSPRRLGPYLTQAEANKVADGLRRRGCYSVIVTTLV